MNIVYDVITNTYYLKCVDGTQMEFKSIDELKLIIKNLARHIPLYSFFCIFEWIKHTTEQAMYINLRHF